MWYRKISPKFWQWLCLLTLLNAPFPQARAADQVSLQLRWDHQFQFAGYYAAAWQGFYAANGLDVEIRGALTPSGILSATQEVREGRADFGVGAADILIADDQGAALSVVAVIFQQSAAAFYLKAETPFAALADLTRLRVARRVNDLIDVELQAMLRSEGLDPATITPYPHQAGIKHLLSDQVQVMPGYRTSIPFLMAQHGLKLREIRPIQYGIDFYGDSLFCQMELTRTRHEMVARFVQASRQGWAYALEHPAEIADQITARFVRRDSLPGRQIAEFNRFQADVVRQLTLYPLIELGHVNPYRWERMHHLLAQAGLVKQALNLTTFVFNEQKFHDDESQRQQRLLFEIAVGLLVALATAVIFLVSLRRLVTVRTGTLRAEIAERQKVEAALRESEGKYRTLFESFPLGITVSDPAGNVVETNAMSEKLLGLSPAEHARRSIDAPVWQIIRPDGTPMPAGEYASVRAFAEDRVIQNVEMGIVKDGGVITWLSVTAAPLQLPHYGVVVTYGDITERKQVEASLVKMNECLRVTLEASHAGTWDWDIVKQTFDWSPEFLKIFGMDAQTRPGFDVWTQAVYPDDREIAAQRIQNAIAERKELLNDYRIVLPSRELRWIRAIGKTFYDDDRPVRMIGLCLDITAQKQAEEALRESEARLTLIYNAINEYLVFLKVVGEQEYRIESCNEPFIRVHQQVGLQISAHDLSGMRVECFLREIIQAEPSKIDFIFRKYQEVIATGRKTEYEEKTCFPNGDVIVSETTLIPIMNNQGQCTHLLYVTKDITDRKRAEEQLKVHNRLLEEAVQQKQHEMEALFDTLRRQEKLATIGQMAGSIAHELRNPLGAVKQSVFYLKRLVETQGLTASNPKVLRHLDLMDAELNTSARVISDLLEMTRQKPLHCQVTDLRALISEAVTRGQLPERVRVTIALESEPFLIYADPLQMHQVFLNLLTNAAQAIEGEGAITIRAKQLTEHGESLIEIYDSGVGIAPEALPKIFEPLYTTKATGTGLGLSICKQIIENHQGRISLTSQPGQGVTVTLRLPKEQQP